MLPCLLYEDDDLLVVNKPAGLNTHSPAPYAGEGLYDWLRHRESRWANLAIIHRLDKETSGVIVFSKSSLANRSLTEQFTRREVRKIYILMTDREPPHLPLTVRSSLVRAGEKYVSRQTSSNADIAETRFYAPKNDDISSLVPKAPLALPGSAPGIVAAEPLTGRTHQIRVHAAERGFSILGDTLYGGTPADRVYLHAAHISLKHPKDGREVVFSASSEFTSDPRLALRAGLVEFEATDAYRIIHGASDDCPGRYVEKLGDFLLSHGESIPSKTQTNELQRLMAVCSARGAYHRTLTQKARSRGLSVASPQHIQGDKAPDPFIIRENGLKFELSFNEGYSVGLFLDQRDNRRRLLANHIAADFPVFSQFPSRSAPPDVLNCFAYTCGFSVCAAMAGAVITSLDLSKKYLEWGKRNFMRNKIDLAGHQFIFGDVFDWLRRFKRKARRFNVVLLDPPTFSQSKERGVFRVEKDYAELVTASLPLMKEDGVLFASTNSADWPAETFVRVITSAVRAANRNILQQFYAPQPPDFPISREEPAFLKTLWLRIK